MVTKIAKILVQFNFQYARGDILERENTKKKKMNAKDAHKKDVLTQ